MSKPWEQEPDNETGESAGYRYEIIRHQSLGHLCGYVDLPVTHPWTRKDWMEIDADVHGGLTYGQEHDGEYRIGFDCAHAGDLTPCLSITHGDVYRDISYVRQQCQQLALQAAIAAGDNY